MNGNQLVTHIYLIGQVVNSLISNLSSLYTTVLCDCFWTITVCTLNLALQHAIGICAYTAWNAVQLKIPPNQAQNAKFY